MNRWLRKINWTRFLLRDLLLAGLIFLCFGFLDHFSRNTPLLELMLTALPKKAVPDSPYLLLIGVDDTEGVKRSDTIMLFKIHHDTRKVNIVSVPRDSYVYVPQHGYTKVNHSYAYGGPTLLKETLEEFLHIKIAGYLKFTLSDMKYVVGMLGGVSVDVDKRMHYVDHAGRLNIDLQPGLQRLNPEQAMGFIRFRHDIEGDITRIKRQQHFIQSIFSEVSSPVNLFKMPVLIPGILNRIETDLDFQQAIWFASRVKKAYDAGQLFQTSLPGGGRDIEGVSYWEVDPQAKETILAKAEDPTEAVPSGNLSPARPVIAGTVEVLNGNGDSGSGQQISEALKKRGVSITRIGNAAHYDYPQSLLIIWGTKSRATEQLMECLGMPRSLIQYKNTPKPILATLVLGKEWEYLLENIKK
jgi:LCP family protein required for cell wall assembly